jgi:hypothetical protein
VVMLAPRRTESTEVTIPSVIVASGVAGLETIGIRKIGDEILCLV